MRQSCYFLVLVLVLSSCRDKVICAAFQSTYILDDSTRNAYFSYAWYLGDERNTAQATAPKILPLDSLGDTVASSDQSAGIDYFAYVADYKVLPRIPKKTKYGIVKQPPVIPNLVKKIQLRTSPKQNVLTPPDAIHEELESNSILEDSSALAPLDSTAFVASVDSLTVASSQEDDKKKAWVQFRYGFDPIDGMQPDQEYYFRRYGWLLQNAAPKEELADTTSIIQPNEIDSLGSDGTTIQKGLKGLFKKKSKKENKNNDKRPVNETLVPDDGTKSDDQKSDVSNQTNFNISGEPSGVYILNMVYTNNWCYAKVRNLSPIGHHI